MKFNNKTAALTLVAVTLTLPALTLAQTQGQPQRGPNFAEIATELNLSEVEVEACFPRPEQGQRPAAGERPDGQEMIQVISCLQSANRNLTGAQIDETIRTHQPSPPKRN